MSITNINELGQLEETALREYVEGNKLDYNHYGLPIVEIDGEEYAIAFSDDEADEACKEYIEDSVWAFNQSFLADMTSLPIELFECLVNSGKCESLNGAITAVIEQTCGMSEFVACAIDEDGRGQFIGIYDGDEIELESGAYAYRIG